MPLDLARWLPEFPVRQHCLYLNHAAVAPLPLRVAEAMRVRIAEQETAVLVGEEEFAANVAPYLALQRRGVAVRRFPTPAGRVTLETVLPLLKPPVKVLALSWVAFHTGWVAPAAELASAAHERGVLVVLDAIQGLGVLPDRFDDLGVDALVADGHKWLLGPEGLGLMVTRPTLRAALTPVLAGWLNVRRPDRQLFLQELEFHQDGRRFEPGATPTVLVAGLAAALDLLLDVGLDEVHARVTRHARMSTQLLLKSGWRVGSP
ncbi:MAG: hypothetical protein B7Z61_12650, partial [Acidobacteria bacterium 37-71-11]